MKWFSVEGNVPLGYFVRASSIFLFSRFALKRTDVCYVDYSQLQIC